MGLAEQIQGVHALGQVFHVDLSAWLYVASTDLMNWLNLLLPSDICIVNIQQVPDCFHARFSAWAKWYRYIICVNINTEYLKRYAWCIYHYDVHRFVQKLQDIASNWVGSQNFSFLVLSKKNRKQTTVREIYCSKIKVHWYTDNACCIVYDVIGSGFLYKMVRSMVGAMVFASKYGISLLDQITHPISVGPSWLGHTYELAPAHGLCLMRVFYGVMKNNSPRGTCGF